MVTSLIVCSARRDIMKWKNAGQVTRNQYANLNENGKCSLSSRRTDIKIESAILVGGSPSGITPFSNAKVFPEQKKKTKKKNKFENGFRRKGKEDWNKISYFHIPFQPI